MLDLEINRQLIRDLSRERFLYCPNPGNAGDAAIACASYQAFEREACDFRMISPHCSQEVTAGKVVVYGGGGNLVRYYHDASEFLRRHHSSAKRLVLLPHSIDGHEELLSQFGENVFLYCRDKSSFEHARNHAKRATVSIAHDMAFMLEVGTLLAPDGRSAGAARLAWRFPWRNTKRWLRLLMAGGIGFDSGELSAFRTDIERASPTHIDENIDISQVFSPDGMDSLRATDATYRMINFIVRHRVVNTDRLHVAILGALAGCQVKLHDNSYHKNRNVYFHSLCRFRNVKLVDEV